MRDPMMTVCSRGSRKDSAASAVIREVAMNRCLRQRLMPGASHRRSRSATRNTTGCRRSGGAFEVGAADQRNEAGDVRMVHIAEAGGDVTDPVVLVPQVVDFQPLGSAGTCGAGIVSTERMTTCSWRTSLCSTLARIASGAVVLPRLRKIAVPGTRCSGGFRACSSVDEFRERSLRVDPLLRDEFAASLPGGQDGERR